MTPQVQFRYLCTALEYIVLAMQDMNAGTVCKVPERNDDPDDWPLRSAIEKMFEVAEETSEAFERSFDATSTILFGEGMPRNSRAHFKNEINGFKNSLRIMTSVSADYKDLLTRFGSAYTDEGTYFTSDIGALDSELENIRCYVSLCCNISTVARVVFDLVLMLNATYVAVKRPVAPTLAAAAEILIDEFNLEFQGEVGEIIMASLEEDPDDDSVEDNGSDEDETWEDDAIAPPKRPVKPMAKIERKRSKPRKRS